MRFSLGFLCLGQLPERPWCWFIWGAESTLWVTMTMKMSYKIRGMSWIRTREAAVNSKSWVVWVVRCKLRRRWIGVSPHLPQQTPFLAEIGSIETLRRCNVAGVHGVGCSESCSYPWSGHLWFWFSFEPYRGRARDIDRLTDWPLTTNGG